MARTWYVYVDGYFVHKKHHMHDSNKIIVHAKFIGIVCKRLLLYYLTHSVEQRWLFFIAIYECFFVLNFISACSINNRFHMTSTTKFFSFPSLRSFILWFFSFPFQNENQFSNTFEWSYIGYVQCKHLARHAQFTNSHNTVPCVRARLRAISVHKRISIASSYTLLFFWISFYFTPYGLSSKDNRSDTWDWNRERTNETKNEMGFRRSAW